MPPAVPPAVRPASSLDEAEEAYEVFLTALAEVATDVRRARLRSVVELDRAFVATEGGRVVGTARDYGFELALPGGALVPCAGLTGVGVLPTHRRRGVLRSLMAAQLDACRDRGEPVSILRASEGSIYGRFGYGAMSFEGEVRIWTAAGAFGPSAPASGGRLRLLRGDEPAAVIPAAYERLRRERPWAVSRPHVWPYQFGPHAEPGGAPAWWVVHEGPGGVDGYARYEAPDRPSWWSPGNVRAVEVEDLFGADPAVEAALWRHLLDIDLIQEVRAWRPLDDAVRWLLADPRQARVDGVADEVWVRLVDVEGALDARAYPPGAPPVVLAVRDAFRPEQAGTYWLDDGGCRRADEAEPELTLDVADLGSVWGGGVRLPALAAAGRVVEHRPGAVERADARFATTRLPWVGTWF